MFSADLGYYIPTGATSKTHNSNVGFQGQIEIRISKYTGIDLTFGYVQLPHYINSKVTIIPLLIGTKFYWFHQGTKPYTSLNLGYYKFDYDYSLSHNGGYGPVIDSDFGFSILQGVLFPLSNNFFINSDINFTYIITSYYLSMYITINAGVSFLF